MRDRPISEALQLLGYEPTDTNVDQMHVLLEAMDIFVARNDVRGDLWRKGTPEKMLFNIQSKAERLEHALENGIPLSGVIEECPDIINYAAFIVRLFKESEMFE